MYLAINALLAHTPCDQLRVLRAKIEDENEFVMQKKNALRYDSWRKHDYTRSEAMSETAVQKTGRVLCVRAPN